MSLRPLIVNALQQADRSNIPMSEANDVILQAIRGEVVYMQKNMEPQDHYRIFGTIKMDLRGYYDISDRDLRRIVSQEHSKLLDKFYASQPSDSLLLLDKKPTISEKLQDYEKLLKEWGSNSVKLGIHDLDEASGGFYPGELCVISGGTGGMKTSLALSAVEDFVDHDRGRILYISVDMSPEDIFFRLILRECLDMYSEPQLRGLAAQGNAEYRHAKKRMEERFEGKLNVEGHLSRNRISMQKLNWLIAREMPDLVVIDYLTMIEHGGKSDLEFVSTAMPEIHGLAQEIKIPILILSQMSRASRVSQASGQIGGHSRGGGIVEELATVEIELRREEQAHGEQAIIYATVTKTRRGIAGKTFALDYKGKSMRFTGMTTPAYRVITRKSVFGRIEDGEVG